MRNTKGLLTKNARDNISQHYSIPNDNTWLCALDNEVFSESLFKNITLLDFSAKSLIDIFISLSQDTLSVEQWLNAIYQYALSLTYPNNASLPPYPNLIDNAIVFLEVFRLTNQYEKRLAKDTFYYTYPFELLLEKEQDELENRKEYDIVLKSFRFDYIYEMMKLNRELFPYSTIEHITGVHYLAMFIARQVKAVGIPVDLGIVSGAAALHDIGKFGCRPDESSKVAYYHYYYSEEWFYRKGIDYIRNIAVNHSTWDLELESLSIESLILIYSDFRVKGHNDPDCPFPMKFYDIQSSFDVILEKLDNVDAVKEKRYKKVYNKLADFEYFLLEQGIKIDFNTSAKSIEYTPKKVVLLQGKEIIHRYKALSFKHSLSLMYQLRTETSLIELIDIIKNETDVTIIRRYMQLLNQFSRYLTPKQKVIMLQFLYGMLILHEEDLRRQAAEIMGSIIASFDDPYSKYLPPHVEPGVYRLSKSKVLRDFIEAFLNPETTHSNQKNKWIGKALSDLFRIVIKHSKEPTHTIDLMLEKLGQLQGERRVYLLAALLHLPVEKLTHTQITLLTQAILVALKSSNLEEELYAIMCVRRLLQTKNERILTLAKDVIKQENLPLYKRHLNRLICKDLTELDIDFRLPCLHKEKLVPEVLSTIYLNNLKSATPQSVKALNIDLLSTYIRETSEVDQFYTCIHLCNLIKNSEHFEIRVLAGETLLSMVDNLDSNKINEIAIELLRGLEIENYQFTKNIPFILGQLIIRLDRREKIELVDDLEVKIIRGSSALKSLVAETISHAINTWLSSPKYDLNDDAFIKKMLGILFKGLVQYEDNVHIVAFNAFTHTILSCEYTTLARKKDVFIIIMKKLLSLVDDLPEHGTFNPINYAYGYNKLYAFLIEYNHEKGLFDFEMPTRIAYFAGTFDPFSLGQKRVARAIRDSGYEVYIDIDNLNWKRRTQPLNLRRKLVNTTIADQFGIYLMPTLPVINLRLDKDCNMLEAIFEKQDVYIVAGEEMISNGHLYAEHIDTVKNLKHLIIKRTNFNVEKSTYYHQNINVIKHKQYIEIDDELSGITSDKIRYAINHHWDLSDVMDELAANDIYKYNMYKNEPSFKANVDTIATVIMNDDDIKSDLIDEIKEAFKVDISEYLTKREEGTHILLVRDSQSKHINALGIYSVLSQTLYDDIHHHPKIKSDFVELYKENTIIIELMEAVSETPLHNHLLMLHTELVVHAINQGYEFCIVKSDEGRYRSDILSVLRMTGYREINTLNMMVATIKSPVVTMFDAQSMLKEEFRKDTAIRTKMTNMRNHLMHGLVKRYPNVVILAFDRSMLYNKINTIIINENKVSDNKQYGPYLCVPFGDIYNRWILPDAITKSLHTERIFDEKLRYFEVKESPNYPSIQEQVSIIESFNRPIILIDDLLDKGLRLQSLETYFKNINVKVEHIVVGIMSGLGKNRMEKKGYNVLSGYFIPRMHAWFSESQLYPFIGGDAYYSGDDHPIDVLPSVNKILPYMLSQSEVDSAHLTVAFSESCLNQGLEIMMVIEERYKERHRRPLTIQRLNEVFITPRIPHYGKKILVNPQSLPSDIIKNDKIRLNQIVKVINP